MLSGMAAMAAILFFFLLLAFPSSSVLPIDVLSHAFAGSFKIFPQKTVQKFCQLRKCIYFCAAFCLK